MDVSLMKEECDTCAVRKEKLGGMEAEKGRKQASKKKKRVEDRE